MFFFDSFLGKKVLKSSLLDGVEHFFSTRELVLTQGALDELRPIAIENRKNMCSEFGIEYEKLVTINQIHSDKVVLSDNDKSFYGDCDAVIVPDSDSATILNFADCVPIILYSPDKNVAAVVHAGWRGTAAKILEKTVIKMTSELGVAPSTIKAAIGPAIDKCCFETGREVFEQLVEDSDAPKALYDYDSTRDKYYVDLKSLNKNQLLATGVIDIDVCDYCTCCMSDIFFSYRKEHGKTARHSAVVNLRKRNF